jgi:hypothetical protein
MVKHQPGIIAAWISFLTYPLPSSHLLPVSAAVSDLASALETDALKSAGVFADNTMDVIYPYHEARRTKRL